MFRSPVWSLVKRSKNTRSRNGKRDRIPNPEKSMKRTKSNVSWSRAADKWPLAYVGIDLHKKTLQVEVQDPDGNCRIQPQGAEYAGGDSQESLPPYHKTPCASFESSSVWYEVFRFICDDLGYDVILSNPVQTKAIAASKKKTDKVDAHILADLLRGGYVTESHVPGRDVIESRQLVRYRRDKVQQRTQCKNVIHRTLLQDAVAIPGTPFSDAYRRALRKRGDYRIDGNLKFIDCIDDVLARINAKIGAAAADESRRAAAHDYTWSRPVHRACSVVCDRRRGEVPRLALTGSVLRAGTHCPQFCRHGRAVRAEQRPLGVLPAHQGKKGYCQGGSRSSVEI